MHKKLINCITIVHIRWHYRRVPTMNDLNRSRSDSLLTWLWIRDRTHATRLAVFATRFGAGISHTRKRRASTRWRNVADFWMVENPAWLTESHRSISVFKFTVSFSSARSHLACWIASVARFSENKKRLHLRSNVSPFLTHKIYHLRIIDNKLEVRSRRWFSFCSETPFKL